jgi:transposase
VRDQIFAAERTHADDTTVPVLAKGKARTTRFWT